MDVQKSYSPSLIGVAKVVARVHAQVNPRQGPISRGHTHSDLDVGASANGRFDALKKR